MIEQNQLNKELKEIIEDYLNDHKGRGRVALAREAGVAYNTLARILNEEAVPNLESVLSLLKIILTQEEIVPFVKRHYPEFGSILESQMATQVPEFMLDSAWNSVMRDRHSFTVVCLAAKSTGTTFDKIHELLGSPGVRVAQRLLDDEIIIKSEGQLYCPEFVILKISTLLTAIRHSIGILEENHVDAKRFHAGWHIEGLNAKGIQAAIEVLREAELKILDIRKQERYQGDISTFTSTALGIIDPTELSAVS